ncbi:kinase-like protein [Ceratobasidium sp. AG-I]|nr:kinase-like protein [Ceratobasidium sp. AG-I]
MDPPSFHEVSIAALAPDQRSEAEERWVYFQPYLHSKGYGLRPRYQPNWTPSWRIRNSHPADCEDSIDSMPIRVLDATRIDDQRQVMIKMLLPAVNDREGEEELALLQYFSSPPLKDHPSNHIVPCLDSFPIPGVEGGTFIIMPLLSGYTHPPFYNLVEVHDFLQQLLEGLIFMHQNNVAHCDIASPNVMMDSRPLYNEPYHPVFQHRSVDGKRPVSPRYSRSQKSIRYYFIDLGYAKWFRNPNAPRTLVGGRARERAPEQKGGRPYDPFVGDVYQLGAMIRRDIIPSISTLEFLLPLARDMTERDPSKRPTLEESQQSLNAMFVGLSGWRKRWPIVPDNAPVTRRCAFIFIGITAEVAFLLRKLVLLITLQKRPL